MLEPPQKGEKRDGGNDCVVPLRCCISLYFNPLDHDLLRGVVEEVKYHVANCVYVLGLMDRDDKSLYSIYRYSVFWFVSCMCVCSISYTSAAEKTIQLRVKKKKTAK